MIFNQWRPFHTIVEQVKKKSKRPSPTIKIETTNGRHWELHAPIFVKDVLAEHPGQAIFASHNRSTPLNDSELLQPGKIYFLSHPPRKHGLGRSKSHNHEGSRHVSFASTPSYLEPSGSSGEDESIREVTKVEQLPVGSDENVTRLKVVLSKHQYEQLLRNGEDAILEKALNPLLEQFRLQRSLSAPHLSPAPSFSSS